MFWINKFHKISFMILAIAALPALSACNTVEGAGKDLQELGGAVEEGGESGYND